MPLNRRATIALAYLLALLMVALPAWPQAQPAVQVEKDVVYGQAGGQKLLLDVYRTTVPGIRPAVILVHGGGWVAGDKKDFAQIGEGLARLGYVAFSVNYRLATAATNKYPAQLDDVQRAVRWIRVNASKYHLDPNRLGALGASAGGHLVAMLGTCDTRDNSEAALSKVSSRVNCVVDLFGPADFTLKIDRSLTGAAAGLLVTFFGKTQTQAPDLYRAGSPVAHVDKRSVPFLIFHGTADPLVPLDQSQRLHDALTRAGVECTFTKFEGEGHGFQKKEHMGQFIAETVAFLKRHLKP